jgi:hypothetical protein
MISRGEAVEKKRESWAVSADCWVELTKATAGCFCTWPRKWLTAKNPPKRVVAGWDLHHSHSMVLGGLELMS